MKRKTVYVLVVIVFGLLIGLYLQEKEKVITGDVTELVVAINAGPEGDAIKSIYDKYTEAKVKIVELPYSTLREQLVSSLGDGKADFDVVMLDDPWFPQMQSNLAEISKTSDQLISDIVPASLYLGMAPYAKGRIYALPYVGNTQLLFYRKDLLSSFGYDEPPDNWTQLADIAKEISETAANQGRDIYGYAIRGRSGAPIVTDFLPIYWSLGGKLVNDRGNPTESSIDQQTLIQALEIYKTLQLASPPGAINFDWSEMTAAFTGGKAVFQLNWPAAISVIESATGAAHENGVWEVTLAPGHEGEIGTSMIGNWLLAIPSDSSNINEAERFIDWLMESQSLVAGTGNPPTRISVFKEFAEERGKSYFSTILRGLEISTPRPRTQKWAQIEESVSRAVSEFLSGDISADAAASRLSEEISETLHR